MLIWNGKLIQSPIWCFVRRNSGYQQSWSDETLLNERTASNLYDNSQYNLTFMLQVNRKFSRKGRNLALKVDYGTNTSSADRKNFSTTHYFKNDMWSRCLTVIFFSFVTAINTG